MHKPFISPRVRFRFIIRMYCGCYCYCYFSCIAFFLIYSLFICFPSSCMGVFFCFLLCNALLAQSRLHSTWYVCVSLSLCVCFCGFFPSLYLKSIVLAVSHCLENSIRCCCDHIFMHKISIEMDTMISKSARVSGTLIIITHRLYSVLILNCCLLMPIIHIRIRTNIFTIIRTILLKQRRFHCLIR